MAENFDDKSNAWHEGRMARRIYDDVNPYDAGTERHKDWQEGHDYVEELLTLDRVAIVSKAGNVPPYSLFGYVIAGDGTIYTLQYRYYHGIVCAMLYPELAKAHEAGLPIMPHEENSVLKFQCFEHDHSNDMRVIRIAISQLIGSTYFSKSKYKATEAQIQSTLAVCKALGFKGRDVITTEYGDETVSAIIDRLREGADFEVKS